MRMPNYTPGFVESYDPATRLCRVRFPPWTDGAEVMPQAMLSYPLGDKSEHTEIRLLAGDRVWLDFVDGNPRHPIITGYRPKETDNAIDWRRWHHKNIELQADTDLHLFATGGKVRILANGQALVEALEVRIVAPVIKLDGAVQALQGLAVTGALTNNGVPVGSTHTHLSSSPGSATTPPLP
jgi:hypothetical protein